MLALVALPLVVFGVPTMFGHPAIAQDNLLQNFPLRVLVGQQIDSGHLPLFDRLADSGTPLLGGMNAGAFFPLTWLFALMPALLAWVFNLAAVYAAAALGVFCLLRWHRLGSLASFVSALVYAWTGAMMGQLVHLGVVQGYAILPWAILAMLALADATKRSVGDRWRERARSIGPSVVGLSALWGLTNLTGEPRAIAEMQLILLIVVPVVILVRSTWQPTLWRERFLYVGLVALSGAWGVVIGLGQLLPGWSFIKQSQRTGLGYQWFGAGSLAVKWTSLLFIPDIFGGNGLLHQPSYFVNYNLPEVTGYVGVVALVALFGFLTRLTRRGWRGEDRQWILYVVMVVVGLFATWGNFTPLGHLFRAIPLYGSTRLQSRSVIVVDLALVILLGWFLQRLIDRDVAGAGLKGTRRWITLAPVMLTGGLSFAMLFAGNAIDNWLVDGSAQVHLAGYERPTLVLHLVIALGILAVLWWGSQHRRMVRWLVTLILVDALIFVAFCADGFIAGRVNIEPSRSVALQSIDPVGRFALVDPSGTNHYTFEDLGAANMNVFTKLPSVQGYGSLIDELYGNVTQTHPLFGLDGCQLARGVYHQLRLSTVIVPMNKLTTLVTANTVQPPQCVAITRALFIRRYFGETVPVAHVRLVGVKGAAVSNSVVSVQLLNARGKPEGSVLSESGSSSMNFTFGKGHVGAGLLVSSQSGVYVGSVSFQESSNTSTTYELNTQFQQALSSPAWNLEKTSDSLAYFQATSVRPSAWLGSHADTSRITAIEDATWGDSWVTVAATHPTVLKRSMEWIPGWHATATNVSTGVTVKLHVVRSGLIQQVIVPPGTWKIHFHYHAPWIDVGLLGSVGGSLALLVAFVVLRGGFTRRRKDKVLP
jgi:hypothetical protein